MNLTKKNLFIGFILGIIIGMSVYLMSYYTLNQKITQLQSSLEIYQNWINQKSSEVNNLQNQIDELETIISILRDKIDEYNFLREIIHETNRWAVIQDLEGNNLAVEPLDDEVWNRLVELNNSQNYVWVGGKIEIYINKWGFRFEADSIIISEDPIESEKTNIQSISSNLDYWLNLENAYIFIKVIQINSI